MELDLKQFLRVMRKRIWLIVTLVLLITFIAGIYSYAIATPVYVATNKLIVNKKTDITSQMSIAEINSNISLVNTYKEIVKTMYIMNIVAEKTSELGLTPPQIQKKITVNSIADTQILTIAVQDTSHATAVKLVNAVSETFKEEVPNIIKVDNVSILDTSKIVKNPRAVKPQHAFDLFVGFVGGLIIAFLLLILLEYLDDTVKSEEDILEIMNLPLIGLITKIDVNVKAYTEHRKRRLRFFRSGDYSMENKKTQINPLEKTIEASLIAHNYPKSPISEQYRIVRSNVDFSSIDQNIQVIVVTSSGEAEGKSTTSSNLAITYAQSGRKTLLIDGDMRKPTVHRRFKTTKLRGLSTILSSQSSVKDSIVATDIENFSILSAGPIPPNPTDMLSSFRWKDLLRELKGLYDTIIIDTPPALMVADSQILASTSDGVILVVKYGSVKRKYALKTIEMLVHAKANIIGVIMNNIPTKDAENYYYYNTYRYYGNTGDNVIDSK